MSRPARPSPDHVWIPPSKTSRGKDRPGHWRPPPPDDDPRWQWVGPHVREGRLREGHWRHKPGAATPAPARIRAFDAGGSAPLEPPSREEADALIGVLKAAMERAQQAESTRPIPGGPFWIRTPTPARRVDDIPDPTGPLLDDDYSRVHPQSEPNGGDVSSSNRGNGHPPQSALSSIRGNTPRPREHVSSIRGINEYEPYDEWQADLPTAPSPPERSFPEWSAGDFDEPDTRWDQVTPATPPKLGERATQVPPPRFAPAAGPPPPARKILVYGPDAVPTSQAARPPTPAPAPVSPPVPPSAPPKPGLFRRVTAWLWQLGGPEVESLVQEAQRQGIPDSEIDMYVRAWAKRANR